jgi:hypothetical protein
MANEEEIVYEITFDLPDDRIIPDYNDTAELPDVAIADAAIADVTTKPNCYPTQSCRSVVGNQLYNAYAPRLQFLQLGEVQAHRSALMAINEQKLHPGEVTMQQMHATTATLKIDDMVQVVDKELMTMHKHEIAVWGYLMTQYNLKPGLCKFGKKGTEVAVSELTQLHMMDTWKVMDPLQLSREARAKALSSLLFLKEKSSGKIKGWACINRASQRAYISKEDAASPTVLTKLVFITSAIAVSEKRHVRCYNAPSAFVNMDVDENVLMVLKGELAEMMVHIAPQIYRKYITVDRKGMPVLYVKLQKALYGLMRASLFFYMKLRKELEEYRFVVNPYDPCVANKYVGDKEQLTVIWHVDNLMGLCTNDFKLTKLSCYLANIYGPKLTMHTGATNKYLGIDFEFKTSGDLQVSMVAYLKYVIRGSRN